MRSYRNQNNTVSVVHSQKNIRMPYSLNNSKSAGSMKASKQMMQSVLHKSSTKSRSPSPELMHHSYYQRANMSQLEHKFSLKAKKDLCKHTFKGSAGKQKTRKKTQLDIFGSKDNFKLPKNCKISS